MGIDRTALKYQAREAMREARPGFWLVALTYFLMTTGVSILIDLLPLPSGINFAAQFVNILYGLYSMVAEFGFDLWCLWTYRRLGPGLGALTQGFSVTGRVIIMNLLIYARLLGWSVLVAVVSIMLIVAFPLLGVFAAVVGGIAVGVFVTLRYALAPYLLADHPDDGAGAAIRRSADLMRGWKWELLMLELSFLGWILLEMLLVYGAEAVLLWQSGFFELLASIDWASAVSAPSELLARAQELFYAVDGSILTVILTQLISLPVFLWRAPYQGVAVAGFYEARLQAQKEAIPEMPPL